MATERRVVPGGRRGGRADRELDGAGPPGGLSRPLRHYVERGEVRFEEWSHLAIGLRFRAAAMGVPFLPTQVMLGSDLPGLGGAKTMTCPSPARR